ncbi:MAG: hypothetical protein BWY75_02861 [bacterium ADurb.Bin425]|nr:MAG: hypothetical protein BWY75_02861 [bacterium ADurb.Bin425]
MVLNSLDATGCTKGLALFHRIAYLAAEIGTITEIITNGIGQIMQGKNDVIKAMRFEQIDYVLRHRLTSHRHHRLGQIASEWAQSRAGAAGHDNSFHLTTSPCHC